jgi:membrane protease YdiL (CAAX protease family)
LNSDTELPFQPLPPSKSHPSTEPPPQTFRFRKVFVGKEGLRAGWGVLIFVALFAVLMFIATVINSRLHPGQQRPTSVTVISLSFGYVQESILAAAALLSTWIMSKIERRGRTYGFGGGSKLSLFFVGLLSGLILISLLVFVLWKTGLLIVEARVMFGADMLRYGLLWLFAFFLVGVAEESLTRGYLLYTLTRGIAWLYEHFFKTRYSTALGFWTAAVILSVVFFIGHTSNPGESPVGLLSVFVGGMFFCLSVWRTGSLWWAIGMHAAWDWGQSFLFGVADSGLMVQHHLLATHPTGRPLLSGGTTGPEGSVFIFAVLAVGCVIVLTLPKGHYISGSAEIPSLRPFQLDLNQKESES